MQKNDQVVLLMEQHYQTARTRRNMTIPIGTIGRIDRIDSRPNGRPVTYVKFRGHQAVGLLSDEMALVPRAA